MNADGGQPKPDEQDLDTQKKVLLEERQWAQNHSQDISRLSRRRDIFLVLCCLFGLIYIPPVNKEKPHRAVEEQKPFLALETPKITVSIRGRDERNPDAPQVTPEVESPTGITIPILDREIPRDKAAYLFPLVLACFYLIRIDALLQRSKNEMVIQNCNRRLGELGVEFPSTTYKTRSHGEILKVFHLFLPTDLRLTSQKRPPEFLVTAVICLLFGCLPYIVIVWISYRLFSSGVTVIAKHFTVIGVVSIAIMLCGIWVMMRTYKKVEARILGCPRAEWAMAAQEMARKNHDVLLDGDEPARTEWEEDEWEW